MTPGPENPTLEVPFPAPEPATAFAHRGNGKVARLPKLIRDQINNWLLDGLSYPEIIQRLGQLGQDLKPDNLSQWKKRGYQDWLLERAFIERIRARQETPNATNYQEVSTPTRPAANRRAAQARLVKNASQLYRWK